MDKIPVQIQLDTKIKDGQQTEYNKQKYTGDFFESNGMDVLRFEEELENGATITSMITIQKEKVNINRSGAIKMNQKFEKDQLTENVYQHPHGKMHMETFTKSLTYDKGKHKQLGNLTLIYTVKLNGQDERKHTLRLKFQEDDQE